MPSPQLPPSSHPHGGDPAWSQQGKTGASDARRGEETASGGTGGPGPQRARSAPPPGGEGSPLPRPGQGPRTHTVQLMALCSQERSERHV